MKRLGLFLSFSLIAFIPSTQASKRAEIKAIKSEIAKLLKRVDELEKADHVSVKDALKQGVPEPKFSDDPPEPNVVRGGNDKAKLTIAGHLNRAAALYSNGRDTALKHVDVSAASSRINLTGTAKLNENFTAGATLETEFISDYSEAIDVKSPSQTDVTFRERKAEVFFDTCYGKLSIGQGESASHRVSDIDLTGTSSLHEGAEFEGPGGGIRFLKHDNITNTYVQDRAFTSVFNEIMGSRRIDRVRYDTPTFAGFTLSASHGNTDISDVALRYAGEFGGIKVAAAGGFLNAPNNTVEGRKGTYQFGGSAFALTPSGWSLGGSAAMRHYRDAFRKDGYVFTVKGGYQEDFFGIGNTCFAVGAGFASRLFNGTTVTGRPTRLTFAEDNDEHANAYGIYFTQHIDDAASEIYLGAQWQELCRKQLVGTTLQKSKAKIQTAVLAGARVKF